MTLKTNEQDKRNKLQSEKPYVYEKVLKFDDKLRRGESIAIIQFQYNYACNFNCVHCSINRFQYQDKPSFTLDNVRKLSREADEMGLARFVITGGEPLIFTDLDELVEAIDPTKFYINCDSNGWKLDAKKAKHLKSIGIDRIQLSVDSLNEKEHDDFRRKPGSWKRAIASIDHTLNAGLDLFVQTVVTKTRLYSDEFIEFVEYFNNRGIGVFVTYAKPVGNWEGNFDEMVTRKDMEYMKQLEKKHTLFTHLTPAFGRELGCIAVKGMISVTQYGDVLPCPYIHSSIGNVFTEPLKDVIQRGMDIKYFGSWADTCWIAENRPFIDKHIAPHVYGNPLPVDCGKMFGEEDKTVVPFNKFMLDTGKFNEG
jgi:MoaA/NifB/PqqE/SkfB family radical SAM enzyme